MHDFHKNTAEALPELLHQLKGSGYKVVHVVPRNPNDDSEDTTRWSTERGKPSSNNTRPETNVVRAIGGSRVRGWSFEPPSFCGTQNRSSPGSGGCRWVS